MDMGIIILLSFPDARISLRVGQLGHSHAALTKPKIAAAGPQGRLHCFYLSKHDWQVAHQQHRIAQSYFFTRSTITDHLIHWFLVHSNANNSLCWVVMRIHYRLGHVYFILQAVILKAEYLWEPDPQEQNDQIIYFIEVCPKTKQKPQFTMCLHINPNNCVY